MAGTFSVPGRRAARYFYPAILSRYSFNEIKDLPMGDIYATPESDLAQNIQSERGGGNIEDAIAGNIDVRMLQTFGEAWSDLKGFKLKCHIATAIWFVVYLVALLITIPIVIGLVAAGADESTASIIAWPVQVVAISATMPMIAGVTIMGIRHAQGKTVSSGTVFSYFHRILGAMLWYLLMTLMIILGYILLIIPGIYLSFAYMFSLPLMIEKDMTAWQALEVSRKAVTRIWFRATGFLLLAVLLVTLGAIPLGIPLIWIVPWTALAYSMVYFKLFGAEAQTLAD
jgi:membrane-anchored glycerophosphoryl diester phosphodiesterase (GDPDase)